MFLYKSKNFVFLECFHRISSYYFSQVHWDRPPRSNLVKNIELSIREKKRLPIRNKSLRFQEPMTFLQSSINFTSIHLSSFPDSFQRVWLPDTLNDLTPTFLESMHIIPSHFLPLQPKLQQFLSGKIHHFFQKMKNMLLQFSIRIKIWFVNENLLSSNNASDIFHQFIYYLSMSDWKNLENYCSLDLIPHLKRLYTPFRSTTHWTVYRHILEPYIRSIRVARMSKDTQFLQIIYQFSTQQVLSKYNSSGRVLIGEDNTKENVIDYIVFEKVINFPYSSWKIIDRVGGFDKSLLSFKTANQIDYTVKQMF